MPALYCIGEVWLRLSPADAAAALAQAGAFRAQIGGSVAPLCAAVARLGGHAALLTQLGDDPLGRRIQRELDAASIDTRHIRFTSEAPTPVCFTDRTDALPYPGAGQNFPPEALDTGFLADAAALHFTTGGLLDSPLRYTHLKAISAAREQGVPVSFAPGLEPARWKNAAFLRQTFFLFLPQADLVFLTEDELEFLFGSRELRTALFSLFTGHVQFVGCVGAQETWLVTRNDVQRLDAPFPLETVCAQVLTQWMSSKLPLSGISRWSSKAVEISSFVDSTSPADG